MQPSKSKSHNERIRQRKRRRHNQMVQQRHDEELYEQARLDPQTVEGQGRIKDIDRLVELPKVEAETTPESPHELTYTQQFWNLIGWV